MCVRYSVQSLIDKLRILSEIPIAPPERKAYSSLGARIRPLSLVLSSHNHTVVIAMAIMVFFSIKMAILVNRSLIVNTCRSFVSHGSHGPGIELMAKLVADRTSPPL